ncbi:hypothetical protein [Natrialba taiwanensis]|uniref:ABM domain-containing protein n=1 Tax=Natrialba taiwanensis DSM 12281 TaxID=1230458 RepID=L9ZT04_9EURY|nr:hypothetical protein [Natrialba taiwanensis]ELY88318.1 hypothetical protein C484_15432 [Natrialba taiwanensis DSM 12281]
MTDSIVYIDRSSVREGKLDELKAAMAELVDFVETNEPEILSYNVYFSADGERMTVMHTHADSTTLEQHMAVSGSEFPPIGAFITLEAIDVYGQLSENLVQQLQAKASTLGTGRVVVHDRFQGFNRVIDD